MQMDKSSTREDYQLVLARIREDDEEDEDKIPSDESEEVSRA